MSGTPPDISVIVPVFNAASLLQAGLSSVLDHTRAALEVICIDDGSTDDSAIVLDRLAASDHRVMVIRLESNQGVSTARNHGLDRATGSHVSFLDADDTVPPGALDLLLATARNTGSDIAVGKVLYLENGEEDARLASPGSGREAVVTNIHDSRWLQSVSGHHCGNLYRRQLLEQHGIRFDADLALGEDQLFQATAMVHAGTIALIEDTVYFYHHYSDATVTRRPPSLKLLHDDLEWQRRTARLFFSHGLQRAGLDFVRDWSYSISNYWLRIPAAFTRDEASGFFSSLRAMTAEFGVEPWHASTLPHHRRLLELIMSARDDEAYAYLTTEEASSGLPAAPGPAAPHTGRLSHG